jgi:SurA-like protein
VTRSRTLKGSLTAVLAALALTACTAHPGSAAEVGSDRISDGHLDQVAQALCSAQNIQSGVPQPLSSRAARQGALSVLVNSELSLQYGRAKGIEPSQGQVSGAVAANQQTLNKLPTAERTAFEDTLRKYSEGQLILIEAGRRALASKGSAASSAQQALTAGQQVRDAWVRRHVDVNVDPRYGRFANGALQPASGSLSVAASSQAVAGASANPGPSWVRTLPANQKCS